MTARRQARISRARVVLAATLMLAMCSGLIAVVRPLPATWAGSGAAAAAGLVLSVVAGSLLEWLIHRHIYHRRALPLLGRIYRIHEHGHHRVFFPTWRYVTNGAPRRHPILGPHAPCLHPPGWRNALTKLSHAAFYLAVGAACVWLPAWLLTANSAFLASIIAANVVLADLLVRVHDAIHYPQSHRWLQGWGWFRFLDRHHYIHHVDARANLNFLLPLADWLFGTLRRSLTADELCEHGSLEEARLDPAGASEPAREVARPRRRSVLIGD
jgi:sterol desaturase/sphingolipid hydroxylase (fatty acid hydroxylase superfamily)